MLGFSALIALNIISKRTVSDIKLLKSGDFVEIKYFNAFWVENHFNLLLKKDPLSLNNPCIRIRRIVAFIFRLP